MNEDDVALPEPSGNVMGLTKEVIDELNQKKAAVPGMFVSAWQEDETGIERDIDDPVEGFLTAAEEGNLELVMRLLDEEPDLLKAQDKDGYTALHRAAYNNHCNVVAHLLSTGADCEARTKDRWTPLMSAANWANFDVIAQLISHGVDPNAMSIGNVTALHLAVNSNCDELDNVVRCVKYLLEAPGIDANVKSNSGDTPLMLARRSSRVIYNLIENFLNR